MTYTISIADHHGSNFTPTETEWPAFNDSGEYCGRIHFMAAWAVPSGIHEQLGLKNHADLYVTDNGQWAPTIEIAEHLLSTQSPPTEFVVKGASLSLFVPGAWAEDNGSPNTYSDYRVYQRSPGFWEAEEIEEPVLVGAYEEF
jgi:hypothetical protein